MPTINAMMNEAIIELANAIERHAQAQRRASEARGEECAALNRINEAQKKVDALVQTMKKQSPRESDWNRPA